MMVCLARGAAAVSSPEERTVGVFPLVETMVI